MINFKTLIAILLIAPLLLGCPATTQVLKEKNEVRDELIIEIQNQIKDLGATPISESEAKFKKKLDKDKYISALKDQLKELKEKKANKEADDKAKAAKNKKQENRKEAIQKYKSEIIMLGETPMLEFEVGTEDKYLAALKKQFEEAKKIKKEEEQKIKEAIPEWYVDMPIGTELLMYARGTAISNDLQFSEDKAINSALLAVARKLQNNLTSKNKQMIKEAGLNEDLTLKTNIERASTLVIKNVVVSGYKVVKTKMAPRANGGYRTYVLVEYPVSLVYKNYLEEVNKGTNIVTKLTSLKNTQAYKDLVEAANTYSP
ncbi:MAG: LPP20 family lipoprotein [Pelagibacteraceae bacterium]|nr:LPP20 family lipoprotein [Pelagibacteraceae bacterium]